MKKTSTAYICFTFILTLTQTDLHAEKLPEKVLLEHPHWQEEVTIKNNYFCRKSKDCAKIKKEGDFLLVMWENWPLEYFVKTGNASYKFDQNAGIKNKIARKYEQFDYTFEEPFVIVNPYEKTPLTAILKFPTPKPAQIKITIPGLNGSPDIEHTFENFKTEHEIPALGLYANHTNNVVLTAIMKDGTTKNSVVPIKVGNVDRKELIIPTTKKDNAFYYYGTYNGDVFDETGRARYVFNNGSSLVYFFGKKLYLETPHKIERYNYLGDLEKTYQYPPKFYTYRHGLAYKPNGNLLIFGSFEGRKAIFDGQEQSSHRDFILEFDGETGEVLNQYDLAEMLNPDRSLIVKSTQHDFGKNDWAHTNGIDYDPTNKAIIVSGRHNGISKIDEKTKKLIWWMTPHHGLHKSGRTGEGPALYDKIITIVDKNGKPFPVDVQKGFKKAEGFKWPLKSHNVRYAGNGIVSIFDNSGVMYDKKLYTTPNSHASVYKIDDKKRTAQQIFLKGLDVYSETGSSVVVHPKTKEIWVCATMVDHLDNSKMHSAYFYRFDKDGNELFKVILANGWRYAIHPFTFYEDISLPNP